jgi:hypothetical protein
VLRVPRLGLLQQLELLLCSRALVQLLPLLQGHAVHVRDRLVVAHVDTVVQRARVVPGDATRKLQVVACGGHGYWWDGTIWRGSCGRTRTRS